eukprot:scaffold4619_cov59-Phaeocystis_antarctica.AAC.3
MCRVSATCQTPPRVPGAEASAAARPVASPSFRCRPCTQRPPRSARAQHCRRPCAAGRPHAPE